MTTTFFTTIGLILGAGVGFGVAYLTGLPDWIALGLAIIIGLAITSIGYEIGKELEKDEH